MANIDEWNEFLENMFSNAVKQYRETREHKYIKQRQNQIDEILTNNLVDDEKAVVDDMLFELGLYAERETEAVYQQGLKDCVWILKNLGLIA